MSHATRTQRQLKKWLIYPLQALLVYGFYGFSKLLPLDTASQLGGRILSRMGPLLAADKKARRNLSLAFPTLTDAEKNHIIGSMWDNLGRVIAEYPHLNEIEGDRVEIVGRQHIEEAIAAGHSPIFVSGHFANWEVIPVTGIKQGLSMQLIYRHANNPFVDRLLRRARSPMGKNMARKGVEGARSVHGALKNGQAIGMLIDQKHNRGRTIPFFGMPAKTAPAVAELALRYHAPIIPVFLERLNGASFRMTAYPPLPYPDEGSDEDKITDILTSLNALLEQWIRQKPEGWLWLHRRWD